MFAFIFTLSLHEWLIYISKLLMFLLLVTYLILTMISFNKNAIYRLVKTNEYRLIKPVTSFVNSLINFFLIFWFISNFDDLLQHILSLGENVFNSSESVHSLVIIIPTIFIFSAFIGHLSRALFVLFELDTHQYLKTNEVSNKRGDIVLRIIIIPLFLFIEICLKNLLSTNAKLNLFTIDISVFKTIFIGGNIDFFESLFWIGISIIFLYILLCIWTYINRFQLRNQGLFGKHIFFYVCGIFVAIWFIAIGYSVNVSDELRDLLFIIFTVLSFTSALFMLAIVTFEAILHSKQRLCE